MIEKIYLNKKGMLLPEQVLKLVLAVISIIVLLGLLTALYYAKVDADKLRQAESVLKNSTNSVKMMVSTLKAGEIKTFGSMDQPLGWHFYTFTDYTATPTKPSQKKIKPNQCAGKGCVCICKNIWNIFGDEREERVKECTEGGSCLIIEGLGPVPQEDSHQDGYKIGTVNPEFEKFDDGSILLRVKNR